VWLNFQVLIVTPLQFWTLTENQQPAMDTRPEKMETLKTNILNQYGTCHQRPLKTAQSMQDGAITAWLNKDDVQHINQQQTDQIPPGDIVTIMHRQNDITSALLHQQHLLSLLAQDIPVFEGDPLQYKAFIKAFKFTVHSRTPQRVGS